LTCQRCWIPIFWNYSTCPPGDTIDAKATTLRLHGQPYRCTCANRALGAICGGLRPLLPGLFWNGLNDLRHDYLTGSTRDKAVHQDKLSGGRGLLPMWKDGRRSAAKDAAAEVP